MSRFASRKAGWATFALIATMSVACTAPFTPHGRPDGGDDAALDAAFDAAPDAPPPAHLTLDATSHDFGDVVVGQVSSVARFHVGNGGDVTTPRLTVALGGDAVADYAITSDGCDQQVLAPSATCEIDVQLSPGAAGARAGTLTIDGGDAGTIVATLTGNGLTPGDLVFADPAPHDFGAIALGAHSASVTMTVRNGGQASIGPLTVASGDAAFAVATDGCTSHTLAAGATCDLAVQFAPSAVGGASASITVSAGADNATAESVSGTGTATITVTRTGGGTGTVSSAPAGVDCGSTCSAAFDVASVTLTATPTTGSRFLGWSGDACSGSSASTCTVALSADTAISARFEAQQVLTVSVAGSGAGTVSSDDHGIACGADCSNPYDYGTQVTLSALASPGSTFAGWSGACTGTATTCVVTMDQARSASATFSIDQEALTITRSGTGSGAVTSAPAGINCGAQCGASYPYGTSVTLTATPVAGSTFAGWTGACSGTDPCTVSMDAAKSVDASFTLQSFALTVAKIGTGTGTVTSTPTGINCGSACSASYPYGATVTLTPSAATGSTFTGWGGACTGAGACTVTVDAAKSVSATFQLQTYPLTVTRTGAGTGTVTSTPGAINCGGACSDTYGYGSSVTLTATPATGSTFAGWSGACSGTGTCTVTINAATSVTASFAQQTFALTVSKTGTGTGTVTSTPSGINCGGTCTASFAYNTAVTLTPAASSGSTFTGWSGACSGTGACTVTVTAAATATANFDTTPTPTLTVIPSGTGLGGVTSNPTGIDCGATCSAAFVQGAQVILTATPSTGSTFAGWSGACSGTGTCTVTMNAATTVVATFNLIPETLTVTTAGAAPGSVSSAPAGISCGATCSASFGYGTPVTLTASMGTGVTVAWSGACTGSSSTCTVSMTAARAVTATFSYLPETLTVAKTGAGTGTITSTPAGISCGATCSAAFDYGTSVTLTPSAAAGSSFTGWTGACTGTGACTVTMDAAKSVSASFAQQSFALTVTKTGNGTVTSSPTGISCGGTCTASFVYGTAVTLTAAPATGSSFTGWSGACTGTGTCTVTINAAAAVTATFAVIPETLTITKTGTGTGTVTSAPTGISCGAACSASFDYGTAVTLTATPAAGSTFGGWSGGGCSGTGSCVVTMTAAATVSAIFTQNTYALTIVRQNNGSGTVTSSPAGINCGSQCTATYNAGTTVTLTATPAASSNFVGWSGDACNGSAATTCAVTMDAAKNVQANFVLKTFTLSINMAGNGGGTVTSTDGTVSCGSSCTKTVTYGQTLTLQGNPTAGTNFAWTGGPCSGSGQCTFTVTGAVTVSASFTLQTFNVTYGKDDHCGLSSTLSVSSTGNGSCGAGCLNYNYGSTPTFTVNTTCLVDWQGCTSPTHSCTLTVTGPASVVALLTSPN